MNSLKATVALAQVARRSVLQNSIRKASEVPSPKFQSLKEAQKRLGAEDGVPVYLKGGLMDKILFQVTVVGILIGLGIGGETLYRLAVPPKN